MILLRANNELETVFHKLIHTMNVNVEWNNLFVIVDNYLILQGEVRSLFFNFENHKVITNIIDLPIVQEAVMDIEDYTTVTNILNMTLYAFGKWKQINGLKVEKSYEELSVLFSNILRDIKIEPAYTSENYRFFKNNIRMTYEEVVQYAFDYDKRKQEDETTEDDLAETEQLGLWHNIRWKKAAATFVKEETTAAERAKERIGNNFYLVGYQCPSCGEKMHMVVYPVNHELLVDTEEGRVYLARAYTCNNCNSFYTPRPAKLLSEGDVYDLQFDKDRKAYEDYLELLGRNGERTSNYKFNEYEADRKNKKHNLDEPHYAKTIENVSSNIKDLSLNDLLHIAERIEEGFYPEDMVEKYQEYIKDQVEELTEQETSDTKNTGKIKQLSAVAKGNTPEVQKTDVAESTKAEDLHSLKDTSKVNRIQRERDLVEVTGNGVQEKLQTSTTNTCIKAGKTKTGTTKADITKADITKISDTKDKQSIYDAKLGILGRMSENQIRDFKKQIAQDEQLTKEEKELYLAKIEAKNNEKEFEKLNKKIENLNGKTYVQLQRLRDEIIKEPGLEENKEKIIAQIDEAKKAIGEKEVAGIVQGMNDKMDRRQYKLLRERVKGYTDVDPGPYMEKLEAGFEQAEKQEIAGMVNRSRKISREDYTDLLSRLEIQDFEPKLLTPYQDKILEKIGELDQKEIDSLLPDMSGMSFDEGVEAYEKIEAGIFLPELKTNALETLDKRLQKIKSDECTLLVGKLEDMLKEKVKDNTRLLYYPARKMLLNDVSEEEKTIYEEAIGSYAADKGRYELPILLMNTSKNGSREGMILTEEHLYYGTLFDAGTISIDAITSVTAKTGLLNKGLYITQKNGNKVKLHLVVENEEAQMFAEQLQVFIHYLQEKPESRKVNYLMKDKHDIICCFRCGYSYKGGNVCPKCGYKVNK